ncbi:MAG: glycosyltransferase, partial [Acidobacteriota bacterium]
LAAHGIDPPYLLYVGTLLGRRHIDRLIGAFAEIAPEFESLTLVLVGANRLRDPGALAQWIRRAGVGKRVRLVGYVGDSLLPALYRNAELCYYLSSYEGFGLPPLEALASGTPVVVSDGLALDDLWPDYPYRCVEPSVASIAGATRRLLVDVLSVDGGAEHPLLREGRTRVRQLSWRRTADTFLREVARAVADAG